MNKNLYQLVFNKTRGMLMAVAENVTSSHQGPKVNRHAVSADSPSITCFATLRPLAFALLLATGNVLWMNTASADIIADRNAPASQQPVIVSTANGIPQVNIQTPSAAGVSRNTYSQLDVNAHGAILNNSRTNVQTQLGGFIQGNPALAAGTARVILNEVNSSNPSLLNGYVEIAGTRAQLVIANPAGISCDGCGFINANRATLTTGTPIMNRGNLLGYVVGGGSISFSGQGMDASQANFTDVIARAVEVNAGIFAQTLNITTGSNQIGIDGNGNQSSVTPIASSASTPAFAIDVAALGGMYAGKIHLIGTEAGVGMRNNGNISASAGNVLVTTDGQLINAGQISSTADVSINSRSVSNTGGTLTAGNSLSVDATELSGDGRLLSAGNIAITLDNDYLHTGELQANGNITIATSGSIRNESSMIAGAVLNLAATNTLSNGGLLEGTDVWLQANTINNDGGQIYGSHVAAQANTLTNQNSAVIAARDRLDIGAGYITNQTDSLLFSAGNLAIGGALDSNSVATGQAIRLINRNTTIEALGDLEMSVAEIQNLNGGLVTREVHAGSGSFDQFTPRSTSVMLDSADYPGARIGDTSISTRTAGPYSFREYTRYLGRTSTTQTQLVSSLPGQILAGGDMRIAGNLINSDSQIIAGGNLELSAANVQNLNTEGQTTTSYSGTAYYYDYDGSGSGFDYDVDVIGPYNPAPSVVTFNLPTTTLQQGTVPAGSGAAVASTTTPLLASSLFGISPDSAASYLIETNPRFADYRIWLSSDYMLNALNIDPALTHKRLGDGFYEQRLVREQIGQLTGRRFLTGYASDEAQYQALMNAAVTHTNALQLVPGVALSADQVAQLTSDIVWLVAREITLPDGRIQQALVPQVYVKPRQDDLVPTTGMLAGNTVRMNISGDLVNGGTIAGRRFTEINANNIDNLGGYISADTLALTAKSNINNLGGTFAAQDALLLEAGNDINLRSTTRSSSERVGASSFSRTNIDRVAGLYVSNPDAVLVASAGNDVNLMAASIVNSGGNGQTQIRAGKNINLGTVKIAEQNSSIRNSKNYVNHGSSQEIGTVIESAGDIAFNAGNDFNAKAATVDSESGTIAVNAANNINILAGRETSNFDTARKVKRSGTFSSTTKSSRDTFSADNSIASTFSGDTVTLQSGYDITVSGSNIVSDNNTSLAAGNDINIVAAQNTASEFHERKTKKSGFSASGAGISYGTQKLDTKQTGNSVTHSASTVGSVKGDISLIAGKNYTQTASNVVAPEGNVNITAQRVDINAAENSNISTQETKFKQSGITLSINNPVIDTAQQLITEAKAVRDTDAPTRRLVNLLMAAQDVANLSASTNNLAHAYNKYGPEGLLNNSGFSLSLSIGTSKSSSSSTQTGNQVQGSKLIAGNDLNITASGAGSNSDIKIVGSQIDTGNNIALKAEDQIDLLAAKNSFTQKSSNKSSSASVGVSVGYTPNGMGVSVNASVSKGRGSADGSDVSWTETTVQGGNLVSLESGKNTNLVGAQVRGNQVVANVGSAGSGNLNIQSLQDTSTYDSQQESAGLSISVPIFGPGLVNAGLNANQAKANGNYASVVEQSGIYAGDDGFQINTTGNTNLVGAVVASTEEAIIDNKNTLTTATLSASNILNKSEAEAESRGLNLTQDVFSKYGAARTALANEHMNVNENEKVSAVTSAAIEQGTINITTENVFAKHISEDTALLISRDTQNANQPVIKLDARALEAQVAKEAHQRAADVALVTRVTDDAYRVMFREPPRFYKAVCPAGANCTKNPEQVRYEELKGTPKEIKAEIAANTDPNTVLAVNGISNTIDRGIELAFQNAEPLLNPETGEKDLKPNTIYLMHYMPTTTLLAELAVAGYEKVLTQVDSGTADFLGYTNIDMGYAEALMARGNQAINSLGHSRGTIVQTNAFNIIQNQGFTNDKLSVRGVGGAVNAKSFTNSAIAIGADGRNVTFNYFGNDPVSTMAGGNEGFSTLRDLWTVMTGGGNTQHSCYGTGAAGCAQVEIPNALGHQGTPEGNAKLIQYRNGVIENNNLVEN
jgi:filamentous hemagglutinin